MLDDLALVLHWFVDDVRPRFKVAGPVVFCDEGGGELSSAPSATGWRTWSKLKVAPPRSASAPWAPPCLCTRKLRTRRRLVAIQQTARHWTVGTTMRYVTPSSTFVEDAYRRAVSEVLGDLDEED